MSNINFANPYLLIVGVVLLLIITIPFIITIRKENLNKKNIASLIIHVIMTVLITLALAKMTYQAVITETNVYVVADVSYSANKNLATIDSYVDRLDDGLPKNSKVGVVIFGKDSKVLYHPGESKQSIALAQRENMTTRVDDSQTDIASALEYTATLFNDNVIKRIVLITDGKETNDSGLFSVINNLTALDIYVDAIYLDNNMTENETEVQINSVDYSHSTYLNKEQTVNSVIQSSFDVNSIIVLRKDGTEIARKAIRLNKGFNAISVDLDTTSAGISEYELEIEAESDRTSQNNTFKFSQEVSDKVRVLFISQYRNDASVSDTLYSNNSYNYEITYYNTEASAGNRLNDVPYSINDLCYYDEIVLSNVDVRMINNSTAFLSNLDKVVSRYGKNLVTLGNTYTQNNTGLENDSQELTNLSAMLPINYGNQEILGRFVTLVIDYSYSMNNYSKRNIATRAGEVLTDLMNENDYIMVVAFTGETIRTPAYVGDEESKETIKQSINSYDAGQGSFVGSGLNVAFNTMTLDAYQQYSRQIYLISDGLSSATDVVNDEDVAAKCARNGISVSTITVGQAVTDPGKMSTIATKGNGKFYAIATPEQVDSIVLTDVFDDITESVIENVNLSLVYNRNHEVLNNIASLPNIRGFYNGRTKGSANTVLSTLYETEEKVYNVPIYSYWKYGNGKVSSFSCDIANRYPNTYLLSYWLYDWTEGTDAYKFLQNILEFSIPNERVDTPFIYTLDGEGTNKNLFVEVPQINTSAVVEAKITTPSGEVITSPLIWNNEYYVLNVNTETIGKYQVELSYTLRNETTISNYSFNISYLPEYNSFESFDSATLNYMVSENGQVSEDGNLTLVNDNSNVTTYTYDFTVVFMIICIVLFVADIIIRRIKLADIKSLFKRMKSRKA